MAASLGRNARVTLKVLRLLIFDINQRSICTSKICCGNTWYVFGKPSRLREIYNAPNNDDKFPGKGTLADIKIPDKIERSPTAILEALASTVNNNINQPIYKSIDDPYLYTNNDRQKKQLLAAMDSGNKTAQMMISMYPNYFTQLWNEPLSDAYREPHLGYQYKDASEEALLERIAFLSVKDAFSVYKELMASENYPSQEVQEKLLEFLTLFNSSSYEPDSDLLTYVNRTPQSTHTPFPTSNWKKGNMAEQVFNSLPEKTSRAYCYMMRGMAANHSKEEAMKMYSEVKAANLSVDLYTYNLLLQLSSIEAETLEDVKEHVEIILRDMAANNVRPNSETFVSVLVNCRRLSKWSGIKRYALSVLSEMKACDIEPTLAVYEEILRIFYYQREKASTTPAFFEQILNEIEGKEHECKSETDVSFYRTAMKAIRFHFPNSAYALKLHKTLRIGKNMDLLGHRQSEYAYYQDLFWVITPLEDTDVVMELYSSVVPFIFFPPQEIYILIIENIQMHDAYRYIPQLYADLQHSTIFRDQDFTELFVKQLSNRKFDPVLQGQMCDIATSMLTSWQESKHLLRDRQLYMDGSVLGHFMITFLNRDQPDKAWELFRLYQENRSLQRLSDPSGESLSKMAEHLMTRKDYDSTKEVLDLMQNLNYAEVSPIVEKVLQTFELSDHERNYLKGLAVHLEPSSNTN